MLEQRGDPAAVDVRSLAYDSSAVEPGALFCCVPGQRADGHDFAAAAVASGAVALLVERLLGVDVPQVRVGEVRAAMGPVAAEFHGHPSRHLTVVGVTGTNGKTTATHLLRGIFEAAGRPAAVVGTLCGARTTPEAPVLQETLARLRDEGKQAVALEVSSHALVQHRVDAVAFAAVVFTNLSQDHLDFHGTMEDYFVAKASLFGAGRAAVGIVNVDDAFGRRLADEAAIRTVSFSLADAGDLTYSADGISFEWCGVRLRLALGGRFNVSNALAAATTAAELGVSPADVAAGLAAVGTVPGRFEPVRAGQAFPVIVDYAHTPDGLEQVLTAARDLAEGGRVIVVFGCGGDRDAAKRPLMGEVATRLADLAVLTSDNPRHEDPAAIIDQVRAGADQDVLVVEQDRAKAIGVGIEAATDDDVVVIAGKGHETVQEIGDRVIPFDDREVAADVLSRR